MRRVSTRLPGTGAKLSRARSRAVFQRTIATMDGFSAALVARARRRIVLVKLRRIAEHRAEHALGPDLEIAQQHRHQRHDA